MKHIKKIAFIVSISIISLQLQGCGVAMLVAATKYGNAKKVEARQGCLKNYNEYLKVAKTPMSLDQYCEGK